MFVDFNPLPLSIHPSFHLLSLDLGYKDEIYQSWIKLQSYKIFQSPDYMSDKTKTNMLKSKTYLRGN